MAGYHYKLKIVPKEYKSEGKGSENFWELSQPDPDMLDIFRKFLPLENHWGETEEYRSESNYSVLYIWWSEGRVSDVEFEYAPTCEEPDTLLSGVISLCLKYGYALYSERSGATIQPNKLELWKDFEKVHPFGIYKDRGLSEFN